MYYEISRWQIPGLPRAELQVQPSVVVLPYYHRCEAEDWEGIDCSEVVSATLIQEDQTAVRRVGYRRLRPLSRKDTTIGLKLKIGPNGLRLRNELGEGRISSLACVVPDNCSPSQKSLVFFLLLQLAAGDPQVSALLQIGRIRLVSQCR
jgi:hypothetical protein